MFKDPLKLHSRYNDCRRHCKLIKCSSLCREINLRITPAPSNLTQYAQKTLCTKAPLSRGVTGKSFSDMEKNNKKKPRNETEIPTGFSNPVIIGSEHAVRRQHTSKMRPRNPFMELSDFLTTQDGIKAFSFHTNSLLLCFAFLGPTYQYQAAREKCSFFTTFEVVKPPLFDMSLFQLPSL